jgi:hypothetical protein
VKVGNRNRDTLSPQVHYEESHTLKEFTPQSLALQFAIGLTRKQRCSCLSQVQIFREKKSNFHVFRQFLLLTRVRLNYLSFIQHFVWLIH